MADRSALLLGVPIDDVTVSEAVDRIAAMVRVGRATGRVHQVATVNVDFVVNATQDEKLLAVLQRTDLAIPDGMPVVWGCQLLGTPLRERTTGVDLLPALVERAASDALRVCLFGGAPGVAERAATLLRQRFPQGDVTGIEAPLVEPDGSMEGGAVEAIRLLRPDVVAVALGNPKQEFWIARHGPSVGAPVFIGVGGTLDFLTGLTRRAPAWMQRCGLEWLHRAYREPRRLIGRYATDLAVFGPGLLAQAWRGRRGGPVVVPRVSTADGATVLRLLGSTPLERLDRSVTDSLALGRALTVDATALTRLDNVTLATVVTLRRLGRRDGGTVRLVGIAAERGGAVAKLEARGLVGDSPP